MKFVKTYSVSLLMFLLAASSLDLAVGEGEEQQISTSVCSG